MAALVGETGFTRQVLNAKLSHLRPHARSINPFGQRDPDEESTLRYSPGRSGRHVLSESGEHEIAPALIDLP